MKEKNKISSLIAEIHKTLSILEKIEKYYKEFKQNEFINFGKNRTTAIVMAEIFVNYYTCMETLFLKISQFFENDLQKDKWHSDLLNKMTLEIPEIRNAVISEKTFHILQEFLRFRHFKRYYVEFEYDWDKLEFLEKKFDELKPLIHSELDDYNNFLKSI